MKYDVMIRDFTILILGFLLGLLVYWYFDSDQKVIQTKVYHKSDTTIVHVNYKPIPEYKFIDIPYKVEVYKNDTVYQDYSKLIQGIIDNNRLNLTVLDKNSIVSRSFYFNPNLYNYEFSGEKITYKEKSFLERTNFTSEIVVRPIHNYYDINIGIGHNTSKIYYEAGLNSHYYSGIRNYFDPYFKLKITF